ncbi:MAG TPA: glycosyltransferase [Candidatus Methanoperedens sp.]|nr:glycosyltransferase [Candidatus Methanoperedens sp.]
MKMLWVSHNVPYPPKTGVLQRNYNLLREASRRAEIHLLAFFHEAILPIRYDMEEVHRELGRFCQRIEIMPMPNVSQLSSLYLTAMKSLFTRAPFSINCMASETMRRRIQVLCAAGGFQLVHFDTISLAGYREGLNGMTFMLNHHNIESNLMERRSRIERNPLKAAYYRLEAKKLRLYESKTCRKFDVNLTVSDLDAAMLGEICPGLNIRVVANGVDTDFFLPSPGDCDPLNLIMVSGMNWYPNRDAVQWMADSIWPLIKKDIPGVSWTIVGAHPPRTILELADSDAAVSVTGFVDDVRPYMGRAGVYLCPMRDGGGTRLKILDALAMGKAIVSTSIGCEGIDVTPNKNVLIADTPGEFVSQIARVASDSQLREELGLEGRRLVETTYSWRAIGATLGAIYEDCVGPKR